MKNRGQELYEQLRAKHPEFTFDGFDCELINRKLQIRYTFSLGEKIYFRPVHKFLVPEYWDENALSNSLFRNLVFNLGMAELVSYWKASCSPRVVVRPAYLNSEQLDFWKKLYRSGLGEFFYVNGIDPADDFITFIVEGAEVFAPASSVMPDLNRVLVPVGGGKDSVVSLELLSVIRRCVPYIMNPRPASIQTAINAGYAKEEILVTERSIAPELLELNERGYLNGHTPFSAVLAFTAGLVAFINGIPEIALSNESSANEPTIPGTNINHQYSKSLAFENDFRAYMNTFITPDIQYYSYLRPLNELQIARLFAGFTQHHESFRSCNIGSKTNSWCGACPKCLFTFLILSPFIAHERLVEIFGKDLFEDESLVALLDQLSGHSSEKPFECIGTIDEVNAALQYTILHHRNEPLPALLSHYASFHEITAESGSRFLSLLMAFSPHNIRSASAVETLKSTLYDS